MVISYPFRYKNHAIICAAIVYQQAFYLALAFLIRNAIQAFYYVVPNVVYRYNNAYFHFSIMQFQFA